MRDRILRQLAEWLRFGLVGILATLTYLLFSTAALAMGFSAYAANLTGYLASVAISYFGHAKYTFRSDKPHYVQGPKFATVSLATFGLTNLIIYLVVDVTGSQPLVGTLAVAGSIPAITWALARFWVFGRT